MSEGTELGRIIWETSRADEGSISVTGADIIADAIRAAGYRKPRTVTTPTELDALPRRSVVLDIEGDAWRQVYRVERPDKTLRTYWAIDFAEDDYMSEELAEYLPATVLHEGEEDSSV